MRLFEKTMDLAVLEAMYSGDPSRRRYRSERLRSNPNALRRMGGLTVHYLMNTRFPGKHIGKKMISDLCLPDGELVGAGANSICIRRGSEVLKLLISTRHLGECEMNNTLDKLLEDIARLRSIDPDTILKTDVTQLHPGMRSMIALRQKFIDGQDVTRMSSPPEAARRFAQQCLDIGPSMGVLPDINGINNLLLTPTDQLVLVDTIPSKFDAKSKKETNYDRNMKALKQLAS